MTVLGELPPTNRLESESSVGETCRNGCDDEPIDHGPETRRPGSEMHAMSRHISGPRSACDR